MDFSLDYYGLSRIDYIVSLINKEFIVSSLNKASINSNDIIWDCIGIHSRDVLIGPKEDIFEFIKESRALDFFYRGAINAYIEEFRLIYFKY